MELNKRIGVTITNGVINMASIVNTTSMTFHGSFYGLIKWVFQMHWDVNLKIATLMMVSMIWLSYHTISSRCRWPLTTYLRKSYWNGITDSVFDNNNKTQICDVYVRSLFNNNGHWHMWTHPKWALVQSNKANKNLILIGDDVISIVP